VKARVLRGTGDGGERWVAPVLSMGQGSPPREMHDFTTSNAPEVSSHELGREEGFAQGREEGLAAARQEMAANLGLLSELVRRVREPMGDLDEQVDQELSRLALTIAQQVLRRELATDPQQIVAVVKEARAALRDVHGTLRIAAHPDEAQAVRNMFSENEALSGVQVEEDPTMARGGCVVSTDVSLVDARIETRVAQIATQLLGDTRAQEPGREPGPGTARESAQ